MLAPMLQEGFYDTSWDGTWRDAIKEKSARLRSRVDHVTSITHFVKRERVSEYPNCSIDAHKRQRSTHDNSHALNSVPVDQIVLISFLFSPQLDSSASPDADKVDRHNAAERLLEPPSEVFVTLARGLVKLVCKGDLFHIIFRKKADLYEQPSWRQDRSWGMDSGAIPCAACLRALEQCMRRGRSLSMKSFK